jgi:tetratricopeptide (TPR) repeat protein
MYTITIEIHGLRQLMRINNELIHETRRRAIAAIEVHGGRFVAEESGLWIFRFERARPEDRGSVLDALRQAITIMRAKESELSGWTLLLDYVEDSGSLARELRDRTLRVSDENCAWVGEAAQALLVHHLQLEYDSRTHLYRVTGNDIGSAAAPETALALARSDSAIEQIIDAITAESGSLLMIQSDDDLALRTNTRAALETLQGAATVRWLEAEPTGEGIEPLFGLFERLQVHETAFWLQSHEADSWAERQRIVEAIMNREFGKILPDSVELDVLLALESYLAGYVRRAAEATSVPVVLCHEFDRWPEVAANGLLRVLGRMGATEAGAGIVVVATCGTSIRADQLGRTASATLKLPRRSIVDYATVTGASVNWDRVARLGATRSAPVAHYLACAAHWDTRPDSELANLNGHDLAWRVILAQDSEVQEILLALDYADGFVTAADFAELAERLGTDAVRVPAVIERLVHAGLVVDARPPRCAYPELRGRLEMHLGEKAKTVLVRVTEYVEMLLDRGSALASEPLIDLLVQAGLDRELPRRYHEYLTRELSCRSVKTSHRLLYDAIPPRGYQQSTRMCMQSVVSANRLRLALLEGNMQAAERISGTADHSDSECNFAEADLAVQRARYTFLSGPGKETVALLKRAIVFYQELDDQAGLARANLDFGLVKLANEDVLGAGEYFLLASKAAASSNDLFEQLRARQLTVVNSYIFGNLSRALAHADELSAAAGAAGMRELQLFCDLTRGRVFFELGRYEEAADAFSRGRSRTRLYGFAEPERVLERWLARSLIYDGRLKRGLQILDGQDNSPEALLFVAEAELRRGNHAEALSALDRGLEADSTSREPIERIGWATGFSALEDRAIGVTRGMRVLTHQMLALRGYVLAESGDLSEGVSEMHRLTRELRSSEIDPYNRIYFYLYSLILPESGDLNMEDGSTVLGKAVRYIQERTSRMDEYAHKTDFLRKNYWNARLVSHAQAHNLV